MKVFNKTYLPRIKGKTFVIGDIHGEYSALKNFLEEVSFDSSVDRVIATGDLINRGDGSLDVLKLLKEPWFFSVLGNHDAVLVSTYNASMTDISDSELSGLIGPWASNGGDWILGGISGSSVEHCRNKLKPIAEVISKNLSVFIEFESSDGRSIGVCHAGVPGYCWDSVENTTIDVESVFYDADSAIWMREQIEDAQRHVTGVSEVCHGHTIVDNPLLLGNRNYLDTGLHSSGKVGFKVF